MTRPAADRFQAGAWFAGLAVVLAVIAWSAPEMASATDRGRYEDTASQFVVPHCVDIHCFRVLVPWILGPLPGASLIRWKAYAVVANWMAAVAVYGLSRAWGLRHRAALVASALSGLGFGSLYTLYDPFTADPLMYALGPVLMWLVVRERIVAASVTAAVGVLAKEFAAAPMLMASAAAAIGGRFDRALQVLAGANVALISWLCLQLSLIIVFNYGYGGNPSTRLLAGGYLATWLQQQSWLVSALALYGVFGALWVLAPFGLRLAPPPIREVALAAIPVAIVFGYVQQPDRAFWNLHFIVTPLAALVLDRAPAVIMLALVGLFAVANLRLGAQLPFAPPARASLVMALGLAVVCLYSMRRAAPIEQAAV